jgi:hypothetical protein
MPAFTKLRPTLPGRRPGIWKEYCLRHAEDAERKARTLSGHARDKQQIVAGTYRTLAKSFELDERRR